MSWKTSSEVFTIGAKIEKSTNVIIHCIAVFTWNTDSSALGGPWQLLSTEKGSEVSGLSPSWDVPARGNGTCFRDGALTPEPNFTIKGRFGNPR